MPNLKALSRAATPDPSALDLTAGPESLGSGYRILKLGVLARIQEPWVLARTQDPWTKRGCKTQVTWVGTSARPLARTQDPWTKRGCKTQVTWVGTSARPKQLGTSIPF